MNAHLPRSPQASQDISKEGSKEIAVYFASACFRRKMKFDGDEGYARDVVVFPLWRYSLYFIIRAVKYS